MITPASLPGWQLGLEAKQHPTSRVHFFVRPTPLTREIGQIHECIFEKSKASWLFKLSRRRHSLSKFLSHGSSWESAGGRLHTQPLGTDMIPTGLRPPREELRTCTFRKHGQEALWMMRVSRKHYSKRYVQRAREKHLTKEFYEHF